jgi:hypothetical protein
MIGVGVVQLEQLRPGMGDYPMNAGDVVTNDGAIQSNDARFLVRAGVVWVRSDQAARAECYGWRRNGMEHGSTLVQVEREW